MSIFARGRPEPPLRGSAIGVVMGNGVADLACCLPDASPRLSSVPLSHADDLREAMKALFPDGKPEVLGISGLGPQPVTSMSRWARVVVEVTTAECLLHTFGIAGDGVAVLADTICAAAGRRVDGHSWAAGNWPALYARSGSAYDVVLRCAQALVEVLDGRSKPSVLRTALPRAVGAKSPLEFLEWVNTRGATDRTGMKAVTATLSSAASSGDAIALRLVSVLGTDIGRCAAAVIETLGLHRDELSIAWGGSVLTEIHGVASAATKRILIANPMAKFDFRTPQPPALAVAELALNTPR